MSTTYSVYQTFIASPNDVAAERQIAEETIRLINRVVRDTLRITIEPRIWTQLPPVAPRRGEGTIQDILNRDVERADLFILILSKRYGSKEQRHKLSNTEREINTILKARKKNPHIRILAFFKYIKNNIDRGKQETQAIKLRKRLTKMGLPFRIYRDTGEFKQCFTHDMYETILHLLLSPAKKKALQNFWQFGETGETYYPQVAIVYPPTERPRMKDGENPDYWNNRLTTQMAFEDYKTIYKLEKAFQLLGLRSYRLYPHSGVPPELNSMNRVWICVPRFQQAMAALQKHQSAKFCLSPSHSQERDITWRSNHGGSCRVLSPMTKYLFHQRTQMNTSGDWHSQLAKLYAKDYAILARFKRHNVDGDGLRDYFLSGIRGLGTWGAAWYVDQRFNELAAFGADRDIQLLLEVTYRDGRILDVVNVSDKPQAYFDKENADETILNNISTYTEC